MFHNKTLKFLKDSGLDHLEYHHLKMSALFPVRLRLLYLKGNGDVEQVPFGTFVKTHTHTH